VLRGEAKRDVKLCSWWKSGSADLKYHLDAAVWGLPGELNAM